MSDLYANIPPEILAQLFGLSTYDERDKSLQGQLAQAAALRRSAGQDHYRTPGGQALGGLADALNTGRSMRDEQQLRQQQQALWKQKQEALQRLGGMTAEPAPFDYSSVPDVQEASPVAPDAPYVPWRGPKKLIP